MNTKLKSEIIQWIKTIGISGVIAIGLNLVVQPVIVSGQSMYHTLENKDYLVVNRLAYKNEVPERGDIIVFKTELIDSKSEKKKNLLKRVIGLPGEHLVIKDSKVYINDKYLEEDYLSDIYTDGDIDITIPNNHVFTMGDNREYSDDSRKSYIGTIQLEDVLGKVLVRMYPFNKVGQIEWKVGDSKYNKLSPTFLFSDIKNIFLIYTLSINKLYN